MKKIIKYRREIKPGALHYRIVLNFLKTLKIEPDILLKKNGTMIVNKKLWK